MSERTNPVESYEWTPPVCMARGDSFDLYEVDFWQRMQFTAPNERLMRGYALKAERVFEKHCGVWTYGRNYS